MIELRYLGEIKEFDCVLSVSEIEDKFDYPDIISGEIDTYLRGTKLEFKLSKFSQFISLADIAWLKKFKKNAGEIRYDVEQEDGSFVEKWLMVKCYNNNLEERINYNTKFGTKVFQHKEISAITLKTIRYIEKGIEADIIPVSEEES
jgi:hypothetical protein